MLGGKRVAAKALTELLHEVDEGKHQGTSITFGHLLDEWLAHQRRLGKAASTIQTYEAHVAKRIRPTRGHLPLAKLGAHDLDRYYAGLSAEGLAPATVHVHHSIISGALSQALRWGWVPTNVARSATLPSKAKSQAPIPDATEVRRLIEAAQDDDEDMAMAMILAALTGARRRAPGTRKRPGRRGDRAGAAPTHGARRSALAALRVKVLRRNAIGVYGVSSCLEVPVGNRGSRVTIGDQVVELVDQVIERLPSGSAIRRSVDVVDHRRVGGVRAGRLDADGGRQVSLRYGGGEAWHDLSEVGARSLCLGQGRSGRTVYTEHDCGYRRRRGLCSGRSGGVSNSCWVFGTGSRR